MSNDSNPDHPQICEDAMRNFILFGVALVILPATNARTLRKRALKTPVTSEPTEKFALHEPAAL